MLSFNPNRVVMIIVYAVLIVSALVGLCLLVAATFFNDTSIVGSQAMAFRYTMLDESKVKWFHPIEQGDVTLLIFSAGCPYCAVIAKQWNALTDDQGGYFGTIIGLSISPAMETAHFMSKNRTRFPVYLVGVEFMGGYQIEGTPTTITLHNGIVNMVAAGPLDEATMEHLSNIHRKGIR